MGCQYFEPCDHGADSFTIDIPKMTFGRDCLREAGQRASGMGMNRVALFTDPYLKDSVYVATVTVSLNQAGLGVAVFDEITIDRPIDRPGVGSPPTICCRWVTN